MISFANLHDDIGNDLFDHKEQLNRLDEFHYPRFKEGNMKFSEKAYMSEKVSK